VTHQTGSGPSRPDLPARAAWRKASASDANSGCVEVAFLAGSRIGVRDSKDHQRPPLVLAAPEWARFLAEVKAGAFDLPL
jgi:uncharacterized protein DUF397